MRDPADHDSAVDRPSGAPEARDAAAALGPLPSGLTPVRRALAQLALLSGLATLALGSAALLGSARVAVALGAGLVLVAIAVLAVGARRRVVTHVEALSQRLETSERALERYAEDVEAGVARRTAALRAHNDELRAAADRAERASRAQAEFLAGMSHELRTRLNGIMGVAGLALQAGPNHEQRAHLEQVTAAAGSALHVAEDILDFARSDARGLAIERVDFALRDTLSEALRPLACRGADKGLDLAFRVDTDVPDGLVGDPGRFRRVLVNLVEDAMRHAPGGELVVEVRLASSFDDDVVVEFRVSETGAGMSPERREALLDAFAHDPAASTRPADARVLGLAAAKQLVSLMGGRLWLPEEPAQGNAVHFTIRAARSPRAAAALPDPSLTMARVLVAESGATHRHMLGETLFSWGMQPTLVDNVEDALQALAEAARDRRPFRLLVVDAQLPGQEPAALRRLLAQSGPPIVVVRAPCSARDAGPSTDRALVKPVGPSALLQAIHAVLGLAESGVAPSRAGRALPPLPRQAAATQPLPALPPLVSKVS